MADKNPAPQPKTEVEIVRDYWPEETPEGHEGEYRVRAGEVIALPVDLAMDLVEQGVAKRPKKG